MAAADSHNLTYDEYVDLYNKQNEFLNKEFSLLRSSIDKADVRLDEHTARFDKVTARLDEHTARFDKVDARLDEHTARFDKVDARLDEHTARFDKVDARLDSLDKMSREIKLESANTKTCLYNCFLSNPRMPFRPTLIYDIANQRLSEPDRALFPRHAKEFYALRDPRTERQRTVLLYLSGFYNINIESSLGYDTSSSNSSEEELILADPGHTVDLLENLFGLREENFINFIKRAQELDTQASSPKKRWYSQLPDTAEPARVRRRFKRRSGRPSSEHESTHTSSTGGIIVPVGWGPRTTPSSQRPTVNRLKEKRHQREDPAESGSSTNPFTSPREPGSEPGE